MNPLYFGGTLFYFYFLFYVKKKNLQISSKILEVRIDYIPFFLAGLLVRIKSRFSFKKGGRFLSLLFAFYWFKSTFSFIHFSLKFNLSCFYSNLIITTYIFIFYLWYSDYSQQLFLKCMYTIICWPVLFSNIHLLNAVGGTTKSTK